MPPQIVWMDSLPSTNLYLKENPQLLQHSFFCLAAKKQTAGYGKNQSSWQAEPGQDLTFSLAVLTQDLAAQQAIRQADLLPMTLLCGLIMHEFLTQRFSNLADRLRVKWPNDLMYDNKKLCGILCEFTENTEKKPVIIIGIGLNVNSSPNSSSFKAVSLREIGYNHPPTQLEELLPDLIHYFFQRLGQITLPLTDEFLDQYKMSHQNYDKTTKIFSQQVELDGNHYKLVDIAQSGQLHLKSAIKEIYSFDAKLI